MEEVLRRGNVFAAYGRVVRNGGAPGVDGMPVSDLLPYCREHGARIREERVMASLERFLWQRLRLRIKRGKSAVARPWARKFLGYTVTVDRHPKLKVAPQAAKRLQGKLRALLKRGRGCSLVSVVRDLGPVLRGWVAYFRLVEVTASFEDLDAWLRRKLRCILGRQWKRPRTRFRKLRRRGLIASRAAASAYNGRGPWWNAGASHLHAAVAQPHAAPDGACEPPR